MSQLQRDAMRTKGCSTTGTFRTLISGRVPNTPQVVGSWEERWIRLAIDAEVPSGGSVSGLYRSGPTPLSLGPQNANSTLIAQDQQYAEIEGTLNSDGVEPVRIPPGGAALTYRTFAPTLLRADRSPLPGGALVWGATRSYDRPDYRTDPVAGHARPVPITDRIGRVDGFEVHVYTPEAEIEFKRDMLDKEWIREIPSHNVIERIKLYEVAEMQPFESEMPEERLGYVWSIFGVGAAELLESGELV